MSRGLVSLCVLILPLLVAPALAFDLDFEGIGGSSGSMGELVGEPYQHHVEFVAEGFPTEACYGLYEGMFRMRLTLGENQPSDFDVSSFFYRIPFRDATLEVWWVPPFAERRLVLTASAEEMWMWWHAEWGNVEFGGFLQVQSRASLDGDCTFRDLVPVEGSTIHVEGYATEYWTEQTGTVLDFSAHVDRALVVPTASESWGAVKSRF